MTVSIETKKDPLIELGSLIVAYIKKGMAEGTLVPDERSIQKWKLNDYQYTDEGVKSGGAHSEYMTKKVWYTAETTVNAFVKNSKQYTEAEAYLKTLSPDFSSYHFERFVSKIMLSCFYDESFSIEKIPNVVDIFIKDLRNEPVKCSITAELVGITLQPKFIEISNGIFIRQTEINDLEKEMDTYDVWRIHQYPTAILKIEALTRNPMDLQHKVSEAITILRLFKVGSIRYMKAHMASESITSMLAGTYSQFEQQIYVQDIGVIKIGEEQKLKNFWQRIEKKIPSPFEFGTRSMSFYDISYQRYQDALLYNGAIERRIANGIMGLEGMFLRDQELQELSYRLRFRVAKTLSFFGYDPLEVKRRMVDAYDVRSRFVHGGLLDYDRKQELQEKYGDIKNLLLDTLNYLRISLVIFIMMNVSKDEFIDTIDRSYLDKKSEERLTQIVSSAKHVFDLK